MLTYIIDIIDDKAVYCYVMDAHFSAFILTRAVYALVWINQALDKTLKI